MPKSLRLSPNAPPVPAIGLYRFKAVAQDASGNQAETSIKTILTPRESESVLGIIIKNFEETFGFLKGK